MTSYAPRAKTNTLNGLAATRDKPLLLWLRSVALPLASPTICGIPVFGNCAKTWLNFLDAVRSSNQSSSGHLSRPPMADDRGRLPEITDLLIAWSEGRREALDDLMPAVYADLRRLAASYMRRESDGHPLQPTALVSEAYLRDSSISVA